MSVTNDEKGIMPAAGSLTCRGTESALTKYLSRDPNVLDEVYRYPSDGTRRPRGTRSRR